MICFRERDPSETRTCLLRYLGYVSLSSAKLWRMSIMEMPYLKGRSYPRHPLYQCPSLEAFTYLANLCTQDATLWIHIVIQILSFGLVFPTGMVLGVCYLIAQMFRLRAENSIDCSLTMACSPTKPRCYPRYCWLLSRPRP